VGMALPRTFLARALAMLASSTRTGPTQMVACAGPPLWACSGIAPRSSAGSACRVGPVRPAPGPVPQMRTDLLSAIGPQGFYRRGPHSVAVVLKHAREHACKSNSCC
jgi:hypothetical protein